MNKEILLKHIAETAYNVGFGAKKHFATFDLIDQAPRIIGFLSMAAAIFALVFEPLSTEAVSATFIVFGVVALHIGAYESDKRKYSEAGVKLTQLLNRLKRLYMLVQATEDKKTDEYVEKLHTIETEYYDSSISRQILFSDWFAHYKFFWQQQISWIEREIKFRLFRDKIPLSFTVTVLLLLMFAVAWICDFAIPSCCPWGKAA